MVQPVSNRGSPIRDVPAPVWVDHGPAPPGSMSDDVASSAGRTSSIPPHAPKQSGGINAGDIIKDRLKSLLPQSWGSVVQKWVKREDADDPVKRRDDDTDHDFESRSSRDEFKVLPNGTRVSPPVSPLLERRHSVGYSSRGSQKPLLGDSPTMDDLFPPCPGEESLLTSIHPAEYYAEKVEVYKMKYSYLKSWPGLLRLLAGVELLFGGMVVACVIAYVQRDSEWSNSYGQYNGAYNNGLGLSGYSYRGPMTPFVLAVAGLSWVVTLILLVMGMTMYYRTILLDSPWWPLTEAFTNVALFLLYMSAGIVYLNDLNRGGLCYTAVGVNPIVANLCRVDGGQMAGTAFIFINMLLYLVSFLVCLKMWRHEAARREMEHIMNMGGEPYSSVQLAQTKSKRIVFEDEMDACARESNNRHVKLHTSSMTTRFHEDPAVTLNPAAPPNHVPKTQVIADYVSKYPEICTVEEREMYRAVFNDQYEEYKELHKEITAVLIKFRQLDAMMVKLPRDYSVTTKEQRRIEEVLKKFEQKKSDPSFLEKKERCDYLKAKLSHIKKRIHTFDQNTVAKGRS